MAVLYSNNASSTLSASITSTATSLSVASGKGALFPAPTGGDYFYVTLVNTAGAIEIMKVTARSTDTLTVVRGQDGTTGVAWAAGDRVELRFTKGMLDDIKSERMPASGPSVGSNGRILVNLSGNPAWSDATFTYDLATAQFRAGNFRANVGDTAPTWNFNNILHAGNYTSYSPSLTGTGASGTWGISITGYGYGLNVLDTDRTIANRLPTSTGQSVRFDFANSNAVGTGGNYAGVMTFSPWTGTTSSTGDASYQLVFGSTATNGSGLPRLRLRNGIDSTWNAWYDIYTSASYVAQNQWTPIATGGVTRLNSTTWSKSGGTNNVWDAQIYSAEALPSNVYAQAQFSSTAGRVMFGLSTVVGTANDTSADYAVIHYAFYGNLGDLRIYESGSDIGSFGAYTASSVLTVTYDGANVRYYKDGALLRTVARATGNGLYFDSSFYNTSNSSQLSNIEFGRMSQHALWKSGGTITGSAWSNTLGGDFVIANSSTVGSSLTLRPTNSASYSSGWSVYAGASGAAIGDGAIGFWNHTDQAARFYVTQAGAGYLAGNSILTAGNYTNYTSQYVLKSGDTMTGALTINSSLNVQRYNEASYSKWSYAWGGNQDLAWKRVATLKSTVTDGWRGTTGKITVYHEGSNHGAGLRTVYTAYFYTQYSSGGTALDNAYIYLSPGASSVIQLFKVGTRHYEVQVRQPGDWVLMGAILEIDENLGDATVYETSIQAGTTTGSVVTAGTYNENINIGGNAATVTNGLTTTNYSSYALPLTGGTVSGVITSSISSGTVLNMAGQSDSFGYNTTAGLGTYIRGTGSTWLYGGGKFYDGATNQTLLHSGNYGQYALPLAGGTVSGTLIANGQLALFGAAASTGDFHTYATTGATTIGGASQSGTQTFGQSTVSHIVNIASGATSSANTKTVNIGTGGLSGAFTYLYLGSTSGTSYVNTYGTLTSYGTARVSASNAHSYLQLNRTSTSYEAGLNFQTGGTTYWWNYTPTGGTGTLSWFANGATRMALTNLGVLSVNGSTVVTASNISSYGLTTTGGTLSGNLVPSGNDLYNLGSSSARWSVIFGVAVNAQYFSNPTTLNNSFYLAANSNYMIIGPYTISTGYFIDVPTGSTLVII